MISISLTNILMKKKKNNKSPLVQEVVVFYSMNGLTLFGRIFDKQTSTHGFHQLPVVRILLMQMTFVVA